MLSIVSDWAHGRGRGGKEGFILLMVKASVKIKCGLIEDGLAVFID